MEIKRELAEYAGRIEAQLKKYSYCGMNLNQKIVSEAMDYSLEAGGKRIRPILVMEFCRMCGGDTQAALAPACALEMIHTFSLIHDDLPCMDNDDFRRGKPSCHKQFGEAVAVLAGDALAVRPFEIIAQSDKLEDSKKVKIISELAYSTGVCGMIGGQIIDMENETKEHVDEENLCEMYALKTGALIKTASKIGCIAAGADEEKIMLAVKYAECIGLAFQIIDDILDVTGSTEIIGKPVGSDEEQHKTTFVTVAGLDNAKAEAKRLTDKAINLLDNFENNEFMKELTEFLLSRNY